MNSGLALKIKNEPAQEHGSCLNVVWSERKQTLDTVNKRETMSGSGNLATYSMLVKSWLLEEYL